jgi:hypothetical protein
VTVTANNGDADARSKLRSVVSRKEFGSGSSETVLNKVSN